MKTSAGAPCSTCVFRTCVPSRLNFTVFPDVLENVDPNVSEAPDNDAAVNAMSGFCATGIVGFVVTTCVGGTVVTWAVGVAVVVTVAGVVEVHPANARAMVV